MTILTVDLTTQEQIDLELENKEQISYLSKLYGLPEHRIKNKIKQGYSINQLDKVWENCYTFDNA